MDLTMLLIILGVALWLSLMVLAVILPIRPDAVRITERLVCPADTKMDVRTEVYSYHHPGQKAVVVNYRGSDGMIHDVKVKAILALWGILFFVSILVTAVVVPLVRNWIVQSGLM